MSSVEFQSRLYCTAKNTDQAYSKHLMRRDAGEKYFRGNNHFRQLY